MAENKSVYVLDCSFCAALILPDEQTEKVTSKFASISENDLALVPQLWWYEISNILAVAVRRKRISHSQFTNLTELFEHFSLVTDTEFGMSYAKRIYDLAQRHTLTTYDAAYLELAIRKNAILGCLDQKLCIAAKQSGVKLLLH